MNKTECGSDTCAFALWDNPRDIMSYKDYLTTLFILQNFVHPTIVVVGVPSNIISYVVFWRQGLGDRMNVCLLALSLVDMCLLLVSLLYSVGYYMGQVDPVRYGSLYAIIFSFVSGVYLGFRSASGCITMVIAVERCLCVIFPLKAASLISSRNMAVIMVCIVCLNQVAFFTVPAKLTVVKINNSSSTLAVSKSEFFTNNEKLIEILENIIMMSVVPLTTFVVTCLSTGLTVVKLRAAMTWRGQVTSSRERGQGQHTALTKMLVVVCCVYILTTIPWVIFYLSTLLIEGFSERGTYYNFYWTAVKASSQLSNFNCAVSFFVYMNRSSRFRKDVYSFFCRLCTSMTPNVKTKSNSSK